MRNIKSIIFILLMSISLQPIAQTAIAKQPNRIRQRPVPKPKPTPQRQTLQKQKYQKMSNTGELLVYHIEGLGTPAVYAYYGLDGTRINISNDILERSEGENRPYREDETLTDQCTGFRWNWVGSHRSGERNDLLPGGIGDVNIPYKNSFDRAAKNHDIQWWLADNFEDGATVYLRINDTWEKYEVKNIWNTPWKLNANLEVARDFISATAEILNKALQATRNRNRILQIRSLQNQLLRADPNPIRKVADICKVVSTVLTDQAFRRLIEPEQPDASIVDESLIGDVGENKFTPQSELGSNMSECSLFRLNSDESVLLSPGEFYHIGAESNRAWMNIHSQDVQLSLISSTKSSQRSRSGRGSSAKSIQKGDRFVLKYKADNIFTTITLTIADVWASEAPHSTISYTATVTANKDNRTQTIKARGACGF